MFSDWQAYLRGDDAPTHAIFAASAICAICAVLLILRAIAVVILSTVNFLSRRLFQTGPKTADAASKPRPTLRIATIGALLSFALTLFFTYRAVHDANLQQSETRISSEGYTLLEYEMADANLRCLYGWYTKSDPAKCLKGIFKPESDDSQASWTRTMLYVEEVIWLFAKANSEEKRLSIDYYDDTEYWRKDVEPDVTGLFSYHIVMEASEEAQRSLSKSASPETEAKKIAQTMVVDAGLNMTVDHLCERYRFVRDQAPADFFDLNTKTWCDTPPS